MLISRRWVATPLNPALRAWTPSPIEIAARQLGRPSPLFNPPCPSPQPVSRLSSTRSGPSSAQAPQPKPLSPAQPSPARPQLRGSDPPGPRGRPAQRARARRGRCSGATWRRWGGSSLMRGKLCPVIKMDKAGGK